MAAKATITLSNIKPGEFISWYATTQAAFTITLRLYDSKKEYFKASKSSTNIQPALSQGAAYYEGHNLALDITVAQGEQKDLDTFLNTFSLLTPKGMTVGHGFTCCGEDQTDADYNDFYINVMGWAKKG